jgi:cleavage and polyadenylation specificity factor subunit 1
MVPKKEGPWWLCGYYRHLNLVTTPDKYPLPNMQNLSNGLHSYKVFSKIYLVKGCHQIPVATEDIPKKAIITSFSLFEYCAHHLGCPTQHKHFKE